MEEILNQTTESSSQAPEVVQNTAEKVESSQKVEAKGEIHQTKEVTPKVKEKKPQSTKEYFENIAKKKGFSKESDTDKVSEQETKIDEKPTEKIEKAPEKYVPNYKFKVKDKEYDIPAWARTAITTKEAEKEFVDLFTKAEGIEHIKESRQTAEQRAQAAENEIGGMKQYVSGILKLRDEGNLDKFFKQLNVSDKQLVEHALKIVERNNLPEEQKALYNQIESTNSQLEEREMQFQQMQQMWQQTATHAKKVDLQSALAKSDIAQYAKNYDDVNEEPGKFQREVIEYGKYVYLTTGKDLSADEAINAVKSRLGKGYLQQEKPVPVITEEPSVRKDLPVIPNVTGRNVSQVAKSPTRTSDLKKLYREKFG